MKRYVSVWLPNWPIARLARDEPQVVPRDEPFALVDFGRRGIIVTAVNAAAAREGVAAGTPLADARAALPKLRARPGERSKDARALFQLARWAGRYGPARNSEEEDGFWADITGVAHLFGGETALIEDLLGRLARFGIGARAGIADTYGAAHALARYIVAGNGEWAIAGPGTTRSVLAPLPVEGLRLSEDVAVLLKRLGLRRIGQLYDIPRASLAQRFSSEEAAWRVLVRLDHVLGIEAEPLRPFFDQPQFFARRNFMDPLISSAALEQAIGELCEELSAALKAKDMGTRAIFLAFYRADGTVGHAGSVMREASNDAPHFRLLLKEKLKKIDAGFGVDLLVLEATRIAPLAGTQPGFAEGEAAAYDPGPLIDRLSNRLGSEAVQVLQPFASHVPERSELRVPALASAGARNTDKTSKGAKSSKSSPTTSAPPVYTPPWPYGQGMTRPPFLLRRPEPISVVAEVPDGPPARFVWRRVERRIARASGPERIAPEWWRSIGTSGKPARTRDYFRIEDESGAIYWVFRHGLYGDAEEERAEDESASPPSWFMHGLFC